MTHTETQPQLSPTDVRTTPNMKSVACEVYELIDQFPDHHIIVTRTVTGHYEYYATPKRFISSFGDVFVFGPQGMSGFEHPRDIERVLLERRLADL